MRPFVQLPMTAWSICMSLQSAADLVLLGRCRQRNRGHDLRHVDVNRARIVGVLIGSVLDPRPLGARLHIGTRHVIDGEDARLAPASMAMLHIVKRPSIEICATAGPVNSITW